VSGKLVGGVMVIGGVVLGIATVHLITIIAVLLVLAGAGTYKVASSNRRSLSGSTARSLLK
jgi:hypothetical protein